MTDYDLVADLRVRHLNSTGLDPRVFNPIVGKTIFLQAAEEIERLRKELSVMTEEHAAACHDRDVMTEIRDRLAEECNRLACRNAVLVLEIDRVRAGNVRLRNDVESAIRTALYQGEG